MEMPRGTPRWPAVDKRTIKVKVRRNTDNRFGKGIERTRLEAKLDQWVVERAGWDGNTELVPAFRGKTVTLTPKRHR